MRRSSSRQLGEFAEHEAGIEVPRPVDVGGVTVRHLVAVRVPRLFAREDGPQVIPPSHVEDVEAVLDDQFEQIRRAVLLPWAGEEVRGVVLDVDQGVPLLRLTAQVLEVVEEEPLVVVGHRPADVVLRVALEEREEVRLPQKRLIGVSARGG